MRRQEGIPLCWILSSRMTRVLHARWQSGAVCSSISVHSKKKRKKKLLGNNSRQGFATSHFVIFFLWLTSALVHATLLLHAPWKVPSECYKQDGDHLNIEVQHLLGADWKNHKVLCQYEKSCQQTLNLNKSFVSTWQKCPIFSCMISLALVLQVDLQTKRGKLINTHHVTFLVCAFLKWRWVSWGDLTFILSWILTFQQQNWHRSF